MKTYFALQRLDKDYRPLEPPRVQLSRSFTKGLIALLYAHHAHLLFATSYSYPMINGADFPLDADPAGQINQDIKSNLLMSSCAGSGTQFLLPSQHTPDDDEPTWVGVPGDCLGIVVGSDNTAVTPTDYHLGRKFGHGISGVDGGNVTVDSHLLGDTTATELNSPGTLNMVIRPTRSYRVYSVKLRTYRSGVLGNATLTCYRGTHTFAATGAVLATSAPVDNSALTTVSPGDWIEYTFDVQMNWNRGEIYVLTMTSLGAGSLWFRRSAAAYDTLNTSGYMIDIQGRSQGDFEYGATLIRPPVVAAPSCTFDIVRYLTNNCGAALTVNEVGLYAGGTMNPNTSEISCVPICIARDIVGGGQVVNNTQILKVTYTPSITV